MYAIFEDSGTQLRAKVGDELMIDLRELPTDASSISFDNVLAIGDGKGKVTFGMPYVKGAAVKADVLDADIKGEKIDIIKFRRRKGYRRKQGHRQRSMKVRVTAIQN
jgi:large subunit ribosomal protein L21